MDFWGETHKDTTVNLKARSHHAFGSTIADSDAADLRDSGNRLEGPGLGFAILPGGRSGRLRPLPRPKIRQMVQGDCGGYQKGGDWEPSIALTKRATLGLSTTVAGQRVQLDSPR